MRLVTFTTATTAPRIGVRVGHRVLDIEAASRVDGEPLPSSMKALLREGRGKLSRVQALAKAAQSQAGRFSAAMFEERAIRFLPPLPDSGKFLSVGNDNRELTGVQLTASLVGHEAKIAKPATVARRELEPELVFVIGRRALGVTVDDDPWDYVAGVTLLNNAPGLGAVGPEIVTIDEIADPYDLWMTCSVNGEERTRVNTRDQIWKMNDILAHFSRRTALEPGDMFSTGAPGGATRKPNGEDFSLKPGDVVECSIEGITTLRNTIAAS